MRREGTWARTPVNTTSRPFRIANPALGGQHRTTTLHDWYAFLLGFLLVGYATFGKGFAYIAIPPVFIGEFVLFLGLVVILRSGCGIAVFASVPTVFLVLLMLIVIARTVPYIGTYGVNAVRDSVVVIYGLFAFIVIALLLERPDRLVGILAGYSRFAWWYAPGCIALVNLSIVFDQLLPAWPGTQVPFVYVRAGECAVHLAGAVVFALLGLRPVGMVWAILALLGIATTSISRGAMLTTLIPVAMAALLSRRRVRFGYGFLLAATLFALAYIVDVSVPMGGGRSAGPAEVIEGIESVIGTSTEANYDDTKKWRLGWWESIVDYTVYGSYFWTGKGFGIGLAEADGFVVGREFGGPQVRSPHSVHMTMLARSGVPGLAFWIATNVAWLGRLFRTDDPSSPSWRYSLGEYAAMDYVLWSGCYDRCVL